MLKLLISGNVPSLFERILIYSTYMGYIMMYVIERFSFDVEK